jgi:hypothetical protein
MPSSPTKKGNEVVSFIEGELGEPEPPPEVHKSLFSRSVARLKENADDLTKLQLHGAHVNDSNVSRLCSALKSNTQLKVLDLKYSEIGSGGARVLAKMLEQNQTLATLIVSDSFVGSVGVNAICEALEWHNFTLCELEMEMNTLGKRVNFVVQDRLEALLERNKWLGALKDNKSGLLELNINLDKLGESPVAKLQRELEAEELLRKQIEHQEHLRMLRQMEGLEGDPDDEDEDDPSDDDDDSDDDSDDDDEEKAEEAPSKFAAFNVVGRKLRQIKDKAAAKAARALADAMAKKRGFKDAEDEAEHARAEQARQDYEWKAIAAEDSRSLKAEKLHRKIALRHWSNQRHRGVVHMVEALRSNATLTALRLQNNLLEDEDAESVCSLLARADMVGSKWGMFPPTGGCAASLLVLDLRYEH